MPLEKPFLLLLLHGEVLLRRTQDHDVEPEPLRGRLLQLLRETALRQAQGGVITIATLAKAIWGDGEKIATARSEVSRLRRQVKSSDLVEMKNNVVRLNTDLIDCDWWQVLDARHQADQEENLYRRSRLFHKAEIAFVRSHRQLQRVAPHILENTKEIQPKHLKQCIELRWRNRLDFLSALLEMGHVDRALTEYGIYVDAKDKRRDQFFGITSPIIGLRELGDLRVEETTGTISLRELVKRRGQSRLVVPKVTRSERDGLLAALSDRKRLARPQDGREYGVRLEWDHISTLLSMLLKELEDFDPQVVVGVGRDGSAIATLISHAIDCRLQGWIFVSRYQRGTATKSNTPYFRGRELPLVRASKVLLVDDLIYSGESNRLAIREGLCKPYPAERWYPDAEIWVAALMRDDSFIEPPDKEADRWVAGLRYPIRKSNIWIQFPWEMNMRNYPTKIRTKNE